MAMAQNLHPLLDEPTNDQALLLETVYEGREQAGLPAFNRIYTQGARRVGAPSAWPPFQYVESMLYRKHQLDARAILAACPTINVPGGSYGWVSHQPANPLGLSFDSTLKLTVGGMTHVADANDEVEVFFDMLDILVKRERAFVPSPAVAEEVTLSAVELQAALKRASGEWDLDQNALDSLRDCLKEEPATWHCGHTGTALWSLTLSPFLRGYTGIVAGRTYLERVVELSAPSAPSPEPLYPSPLSLPEAIDYLNMVWRAHANAPMFKIGRAEAAAKLVLDCTTVEEFESRLSALCSILDSVSLPDDSGKKLVNLDGYLHGVLTDDSAERASEAINDLRAMFDIRVGRQHAGTEERARRGMSRLGLAVPIYDWGAAWQHVQVRAVGALSALREEVETLLPE
jgi:hypothetical protein